jgi:hypothetical protein
MRDEEVAAPDDEISESDELATAVATQLNNLNQRLEQNETELAGIAPAHRHPHIGDAAVVAFVSMP